ncbi:hypothetical protein V2J09_001399 [Rumex salicifolius]
MLQLVTDFKEARANHNGRGRAADVPSRLWHLPPVGLFKINVDAVCFDDFVGIGVVARDATSGVVMSATKRITWALDATLAEAKSITWALDATLSSSWSMDLGRSYSDSIVADIVSLCDNIGAISFTFVRQAGNIVAHLAARLNISNNAENVYLTNSSRYN